MRSGEDTRRWVLVDRGMEIKSVSLFETSNRESLEEVSENRTDTEAL